MREGKMARQSQHGLETFFELSVFLFLLPYFPMLGLLARQRRTRQTERRQD
jgi:hypothetical protein